MLSFYILFFKSLSMKLPVAPESRRALTEWSSLVSVVPISTGRRREVPRASKALIAKSLGSLIPSFLIHPHKLFTMQLGPGTASLACARLIVPFVPFNVPLLSLSLLPQWIFPTLMSLFTTLVITLLAKISNLSW